MQEPGDDVLSYPKSPNKTKDSAPEYINIYDYENMKQEDQEVDSVFSEVRIKVEHIDDEALALHDAANKPISKKGSHLTEMNVPSISSSDNLTEDLVVVKEDHLDNDNESDGTRMEIRQRASTEQYTILLEFMERNGDLARPPSSAQGRLKADRLWQELTGMINALSGGAEKPTEKWKKVWADWKTKTKKKAIIIKKATSSTGGGSGSRLRLSALEKRVLNILGLSVVKGAAQIQQRGFKVQQVPKSEEKIVLATPTVPLPPSTLGCRTVDSVPASVECLNEAFPSQRVKEDVKACTMQDSALTGPGELATARRRRRRRALTPFERAVTDLVAVERRRLRAERERDRRLHERELERERMVHEREMQRLQVESQRVEVERIRNNILQSLTDIPQLLIQLLQQSRQ